MYAVIVTGGKQYKVQVDDVLKVEKLENEVGDKITFDAIFVNNDGSIVADKNANTTKVVAEVVSQGKNPKIIVFKYKSKKHYKKTYGHRQPYTEIKILSIKND